MKITTEQQLQEHAQFTRRGAVEGALVGSVIAGASSFYMHRRWAGYRHLPPSLKALGAIIIIAPALAIQAERRGLQYERSQWEGEGFSVLQEQARRQDAGWTDLSQSEKILSWVDRNQYSLILGGWAGGIATATGIIWKDRYQTPPQKVVQIRMWAQGLTIALILAGGALTHFRAEKASKRKVADHSWQDVLAEQERQRHEDETHGSRPVTVLVR